MDKVKEPPDARALRVFKILRQHPELTNWDLICFAGEFLGSQALVPENSWLKAPAAVVLNLIYNAHYTISGDEAERDSR